MPAETYTAFRSCNLCEAICGLKIEHDGEKVISIRGDAEDPLSRGHICPKAIALQDVHSDPDRLRTPVQRTDSGFEPIAWDDAFDLIASKIGDIRGESGDDAVALYLGNPTVHNSGAMLFQNHLKRALRTRNNYSATSVDQLPHHLAANEMFGHGLFIPVPDIDHTNFFLILGANPAASNGSLMTAPGVKDRLGRIKERGGRIILLDPRKTETARHATEHHFIRPGNDVFFLAALLQVVFADGLVALGRLERFTRGIDALGEAVADFTPEMVAEMTGIEATTIREIATSFAGADSAVAYGRMGASTQPHGGLCHWLINTLNVVTGNLDRSGGAMFPNPAIPLVRGSGTTGEFGRWRSRVRQLPEFEGALPVSTLAEEILTPGEGKVRALITNAGNPVLSTPNGTQFERALGELDFYVALDIYINETTRHADIILPSPSGLETDHYDLAFLALAVRNVAKFSPQVFPPAEGSLYDWEIMKELALRLMPAKGGMRRWLLQRSTPDRLLDAGLRTGPYGLFRGGLSLPRLKSTPHGIDLGPLIPRLPKALKTPDSHIDAAPEIFREHLKKLRAETTAQKDARRSGENDQFKLIGRRHLRSNNSWMHNSERLVKGSDRCTLMMRTGDAEPIGLEDGQQIVISSPIGSVETTLELTDSMMPGVVSLPHGYGHHRPGTQLSVASRTPGVSINDLTDDKIVDSLTGNAAFSGQLVTVRPASNPEGVNA